MKYRFRATRVEVVERTIQASSEEDAERKVREELRVSWAFAGSWKTVALEVEVLEAVPRVPPRPIQAAPADGVAVDDGPLGLTMKDAGKLVGVDYRTIRAGIENGTIPTIQLGNRRLIPRSELLRVFGVDGRAD